MRVTSAAASNSFHSFLLPKFTSGQSLPVRKIVPFVNQVCLSRRGEAISLIHEFPLVLENFSLAIAPIPQYPGWGLLILPA